MPRVFARDTGRRSAEGTETEILKDLPEESVPLAVRMKQGPSETESD